MPGTTVTYGDAAIPAQVIFGVVGDEYAMDSSLGAMRTSVSIVPMQDS